MTHEQLKNIHVDYRRAVEVARDENESQEARDAATIDAQELRLKLDEALIDVTRDAEIGEARSRMDDILRPAGNPAPGYVDPGIQAIRDLCRPPEKGVTPRVRCVELPGNTPLTFSRQYRADEEWFKDTAKTTKAGYLYTDQIMNEVIYHENAESAVLLSGVTYVDTDHGRQLKYPILATDASAGATAERTAATLTEPVFGQGVLDSYRQDGYMTLTEELARDSELNVWPIVADVATRAIATRIATAVATGSGTGPQGLSVVAASGKTAAAKTTFTFDELQELYLSLLPSARMRGSWICGSTAFGIIFKMKDADGRPLMQPAISAGMPDTLMGKPIREDAAYPACTTTLKPVTFGDVSAYRVRRIGGVRIERDDSVYFTQFESVVRFAAFIDADLFDTAKVKALTLA
jgi:HK97 family phage major capsid protein